MNGRGAAVVLAAAAVLAAACGNGTEVDRTVPASAPAASSTTASSTTAVVPGPDGDVVPESLLLPDEGGRSDTEEFTDWMTDETVDRAWLLDPCQPTAYPTDRQRTRFRTVSREGPEAYDARQLGVYPSDEVAAEVLAGFRRALEGCRTGQRPSGTAWTWVTRDVPDLGDEGLLAASTFGAGQHAAYGDRIAVTRVGNAVFLAYAYGEYYTAELDGGTEAAQEVAQRFLDSL